MARIAVSGPIPAALAATQSFQSLECRFLSLFHFFTLGNHASRLAGDIVYMHVSAVTASRAPNRLSVPRRVESMRAPS
jgi:hypothetical protein